MCKQSNSRKSLVSLILSFSIITGAGNGIGLSTTQQLLASGHVAHVVAVDTDDKLLKEFQEQHAERLHIVVGDVSHSTTNERAVQTALQHGGRIDSLVLNAATVDPIGTLPGGALADWKKLFDVNFFATLEMVSSMSLVGWRFG